MTLHQISPGRPLLARKGAAAPAAKTRGQEEAGGAEERPCSGAETKAESYSFSLVNPEAKSPNGTQPNGSLEPPGPAVAEPPPPASLLPFSLHRSGVGESEVLPDDAHEAYVDPMVLARGASEAPPEADEASNAPASNAPASNAPASNDTVAPLEAGEPAGPRLPEEAGAAAVPETAGESVRAAAAAPRRSDGFEIRWLLAFLFAAIAVAAAAWWGLSDAPTAVGEAEAPVAQDTASAPAADAGEATAPANDAAGLDDTGAETAPTASIAPSVDVVRIDPGGETVIAGRAAPGSELIVLDRGTPLGTVKADAYGEWVFLPSEPLPAGEHEFGLVVKSVQGRVVVPAPSGSGAGDAESEAAPGSREIDPPKPRTPPQERLQEIKPGSSEPAPIPPRKPAEVPEAALDVPAGATAQGSGDFLVQLASVKTRDGALQEWGKLKSRFPDLLDEAKLSLDETRLGGRGRVVRVRVGPFEAQHEAAAFCAVFTAARQECLVLQTADAARWQ